MATSTSYKLPTNYPTYPTGDTGGTLTQNDLPTIPGATTNPDGTTSITPAQLAANERERQRLLFEKQLREELARAGITWKPGEPIPTSILQKLLGAGWSSNDLKEFTGTSVPNTTSLTALFTSPWFLLVAAIVLVLFLTR
ncbi:hypothetical protein F5984_18860 [Rudanella paleaurantiibacter]|uniref:Uncharacterized protein n=1 Tax=Rudanella paleaurantiibacter TaxID=2614655 RepID=A0A7J5TVW2_9BACT|nr:hypothetical protein [Rudanella paleaurantiibacter]KAB7728433.1 hypothetical protein F5984_18860 [Rudanella paleaurantiibacter]